MNIQPQPGKSISPQICELASSRGVGTPLKRQRRNLIQMFLLFELLVVLFVIGWIIYNIYGYVAFNILSHTYPDINSVPDNQLANYTWFRAIHDQFWRTTVQSLASLGSVLVHMLTFYSVSRTELYICTEGLLKIDKKKEESVRWDEVEELQFTNNKVTSLVKQDGSSVSLPALLIDKTLTALISDEVTRCLLPGMLARYEQGETITFGDLEVNQKGISRPGRMVFWGQVGDVFLKNQTLSLYYSGVDNNGRKEEKIPPPFVGKWHTWRRSAWVSVSWPNLPTFVALVNKILDQRGVSQMVAASPTQQAGTIKEIAAVALRKRQRKTRMTIAIATVSIISALALIIGIPVYQSVQEQQRAERDTRLLLNYFTQRAHKAYTAQVPGEHCGDGKEYWLDDDSTNVYSCQKDGLLMTQKNFRYVDGEYFTFVPDALSMNDAFSSGHYFPHNYRVEVNTTIVSGGPGTCVEVEAHIQNFQGRQWFEVCAGGSWSYYRCDLHCNKYVSLANGMLPAAKEAYLIALVVSDTSLTLYVDNARVTTVYDSTYSSTDQLELALYGDQSAGEPVTARFSDFYYAPLGS